VPLADAAGAASGGMALCRDVTEQRRPERLLRASQRQLAEAQRIAHVGSWEWDLATDDLSFSEELCRIFGLPPGSKVTMSPGVEPADPPRRPGAVQAGAGAAAHRPGPLRLRAPDHPHRRRRPHGHGPRRGVVDEHGQVVRFIGTDQDITDRRRADAERRRLLNRVDEAQEGQDRRLAADLHDGHVQSLAAIGFKLEQARLRPLVLVEDGLEAALREEAKTACNRAALASCEVTSELDGRLDRWGRRPCSGSPSSRWPPRPARRR
jgi:signal transduction histidine kinase